MALAARKLATYDDILALPDHITGEIVNGELFTMPRPRPRHSRLERTASASFDDYDGPPGGGGGKRDGPGGWILLVEPEVHFDGDVVVPDLAGWRRTTLPRVPDTAFIDFPPDWVLEVISPRTARFDRVEKRALYARWGVEWLWYADPDTRVVETLQLTKAGYVLKGSWGDNATMAADPFPLAEVQLGVWWGDE